ncbi:MAG: HEAT repeat domain-containing protein, partial [Myxococcota bacterium]
MASQFESQEFDFDALEAMRGQLDENELADLLNDGRGMVRSNAVRALAVLGIPSPQIVPMLRDSDLDVARAAAEAIQRLGARIRPLIARLGDALDNAHPAVAAVALDAIASLVGEADEEIIEALDVSPEVGQAAIVEAVVRAGESGAQLLAKAMAREQTLIRFNSAHGLHRLARSGRIAGFSGNAEIMRTLVEVRGTDTAPDVRAAAGAAILAIIGQAQAVAAYTASARAMASADIKIKHFELRPLSAEELSGQVSANDIEQMTDTLQDGRYVVRANAARALSTLGQDAAVAIRPIAVLLRDSVASVRRAAAQALGALGSGVAEVADNLVKALGDDDPLTAKAAQDTLRPLGGAVLPQLIQGLETDRRTHALRIVELIADSPEAVDILCQAFTSPAGNVRVNAALGLGWLGPDRIGRGRELLEEARTGGDARTRAAVREALEMSAVPPASGPPPITIKGFDQRYLPPAQLDRGQLRVDSLLVALRDGRGVVRANAAAGLGVLGPDAEAAVLALSTMVRDNEPEVRRNAAAALGQLGEAAIPFAFALVGALADSDTEVVKVASDALGRLGEAALPALIDGLDTGSREHAIRIVG